MPVQNKKTGQRPVRLPGGASGVEAEAPLSKAHIRAAPFLRKRERRRCPFARKAPRLTLYGPCRLKHVGFARTAKPGLVRKSPDY